MKTISIITICYNNFHGLVRTMESVRMQTFRDIEYIIIDGGSNDGSVELIQKHSDIVSYYCSEPDKGIYDAINKGIQKATGEWLLCLNAGDVFVDCSVLSNIFNQRIRAEVTAIYSDFISLLPGGQFQLCHTDRAQGIVMHQSCIYRRNLHDRFGLYLVTKPYIVSDFIFLMMIPEAEYLKLEQPISINVAGGISQQGTWCTEGALGIKVAFRIISMHKAYLQYWKAIISNHIPEKCKFYLKKYIFKRNLLTNNN